MAACYLTYFYRPGFFLVMNYEQLLIELDIMSGAALLLMLALALSLNYICQLRAELGKD